MIIGTCGFCSTGSSAVSDYLKEFDEVQTLDQIEFVFAYLPDGLDDLYYHLVERPFRDDSSAIAIPRFRKFMDSYKRTLKVGTGINTKQLDDITERFLCRLIQLRWKGLNRSDGLINQNVFYRYFGLSIMAQRLIPYLNRRYHRTFETYPYRDIELSIKQEGAIEIFKDYIKDLLDLIGADYTKKIILDQPFVGNDPASSFRFYEDPYAIVVDRDPRDNYIFAREYLYKRGKFMPTNNVREFVQYYLLMRENMPYTLPNPRIMRIHFEDMVYDYDNTTKKIRGFLGLGENTRPMSIFDPKLSINNTQLSLRFPQYADDIRYIEEKLTDYLYDFSRFPKPDHSGQMFMGKSPLNNH